MKKTRILSLALAAMLAFEALPQTVYAADSSVPTVQAIAADSAADAVDSSGVQGLSAQKSYAGPDDLDFDGEALLLYELNTGTMVYAKNIDQQREPASLTKVMTCLLALEHGNLSDQVSVSASALSGLDPDGSIVGLVAGETFTLEELLYCLMVKSSNDAAAVIAEHIGGTQDAFVDMMNEKASELGCENTHFENPHGLHAEGHYTCARDMARIMSAALSYPMFEELCSTTSYTLPATDLASSRSFTTTNYLITDAATTEYLDDRVIGGKTGFTTPAGRCLVCVAEQEDLRYLAVVLGASSQDADGNSTYGNFTTAKDLFDYGFDSFVAEEIFEVEQETGLLPVDGTDDPAITEAADTVVVLLPKDYDDLQLYTECLPEPGLSVPISAGEAVGTASVYYGDLFLGSTAVIATYAVETPPIITPSSTEESPEPDETGESSGHRFFRITITVIAAVIGIGALILLLLIIRASIIRSLRRCRRQKRRQNRPRR